MKIGKYDATEIEVGDERYDPLVFSVSANLCDYTIDHPGYIMVGEWNRYGLPWFVICSEEHKNDLRALDRKFADVVATAAEVVNRDQTWDGTFWRIIRENEPEYNRIVFYSKGRMFYWEKPL